MLIDDLSTGNAVIAQTPGVHAILMLFRKNANFSISGGNRAHIRRRG
jgi:hypothetical protein